MKKTLLWKALCLLIGTMGLVACSDDDEGGGESENGGKVPYSILIEVLNTDGVDLLNSNNEGNLCAGEWSVTLDGKAYVIYEVDETPAVDANKETYFKKIPWSTGVLEGIPYYATAKISISGARVQETDGKYREIVFDWGEGIEKDVFRIKISWETGKGWETESTLNGKPIDDLRDGIFTFVK